MKICFLFHDLNIKDGIGRISFEIVKNLKKIDPTLDITAMTSVGQGFSWEKDILKTDKLKFITALFKIREIFKQSDIIHAFDGWPYGVIMALASIGLKKHKVITTVGSGSIRPLYQFLHSWLLRWAYKKADKIISISSYTAREINKKIPSLKFEVIPLGVDYNYFSNLSNKSPRLISSPYLLSVGNFKARKGYLESIGVFAKINKMMPQLKYVIVAAGRGPYFQRLQKLIEELDLKEKIIFKENISDEDLASLYQHAELFWLLPQNSNYDVEGFGLVFLEAAAFGLPVVGTLDCGAEDAVLNNQNGYLFPPRDLEAIGNGVLKILQNKNLRQEFSNKSVEFAKNMSLQKTARKYFEIYHNLGVIT